MFGPCMCGDTMCPSCGPAQGYDPQFEALCERVADRLPALLDGIVNLTTEQENEMLEAVTELIAAALSLQESQAEMDRAREIYEERKANEY